MTCLACSQETNVTKTVIKNGQVVRGCEQCLTYQLQQGDTAKYNREWQKAEYRRDLTQPNQGREFIKAYGVDAAREYMTDEDIRRLS